VPSSKRYLTEHKAAEIIQSLNASGCTACYVGVFADPDLQHVNEVAAHCGFHYAQLHGLDETSSLHDLHVPAIIAHRVRDRINWQAIMSVPAWAYLLDSYKAGQLGGTGTAWHWDLAQRERPEKTRIILAGGLLPDNVREAVRQVQPWGVDVASGTEASPGIKDPDKVARFIRFVREEDQR